MVLSNRIPLLTLLAGSLLGFLPDAKKAAPPQAEVETLQTASRDRKARGRSGREPEPRRQGDLDDTVRRSASPAGERSRAYLSGTIKFVIESETPELDGVAMERLERSYEYVWDPATGAWIPKY
jgi:hypothetical protein